MSVSFAPTATGARSATITVTSNGTGSPQAIAASGTGSSNAQPGQLSFQGSVALPDTQVGSQSAASIVTISNAGGAPVTIGSVSSQSAAFLIVSDGCSGTVVQAGASCQFGVAFKPSGAGPASTVIIIASDGAGSPQGITATGNGLAGGMNINQQGLTGSWYQAITSGQGIEIEVYPNLVNATTGYLQGSWFTFDFVAPGGAASQRWYTFGGNAPSGQSNGTFTLYQNVGGNFNAAPITTATPVGTVTLNFTDCTNATMTYTFTDGSGRSGSIPLVRLTPNVTCVVSGSTGTNVDFAYSGNWYDPATSGQGLVIELNPNAAVVFFAWYTYAPNGQAQGAAGQRWYTGQAAYTLGARTLQTTLYETTGGLFNSVSPAPQTAPVGTATLQFTACNAAKLTFNFTGASSAGQSGTINLQRVGPVPAGCQ
ncbi:MAG TPA: choice-of-anchor D domain-containing protein [Casimicrobiaceae bacterium]|nr:choice-of-anchor D domain-containing protein [Casimicrobiaceae bacterium]